MVWRERREIDLNITDRMSCDVGEASRGPNLSSEQFGAERNGFLELGDHRSEF